MFVSFNPMVSNKQQKQNFCAVNQKYYQKAQEAVKNKTTYYFAVRDLQEAYGVGTLSKTDTNDTLDAIKKIYPEKFHHVVDTANKWVEEFSKK